MPAAARVTDHHVCPMHNDGTPHVGGPVTGPGVANVLIGGLPAAVKGDNAVCVGSVDNIVGGSTTVRIGGKPAARVGDAMAHAGTIATGCASVVIGG
jgi:uncharacterized Zn-binding protein involved in type VI secretion